MIPENAAFEISLVGFSVSATAAFKYRNHSQVTHIVKFLDLGYSKTYSVIAFALLCQEMLVFQG